MNGKEFLELHQKNMEVLGFWDEDYKVSIMKVIETRYSQHIIKDWGISDITINDNKVLLKWFKRVTPLCREEMIKRFGSDFIEY